MLTESEIFSQLQDSLKKCEGACRQLAHWRGDPGWLMLGAKFADMQRLALRMASKRGGLAPFYIDPARRQN